MTGRKSTVPLVLLTLCLLMAYVTVLTGRSARADAGRPTPAAAAAPVLDGPVFNDPTGAAAQRTAVMDQLIGLITATPDAGEIDFVMHQFMDEGRASAVLDALTGAISRGVQVRVILDGENAGNPQIEEAISLAVLTSPDPRDSGIVTCPPDRGCIGSAYTHTKMATFSSVVVDGVEHDDVVFQTSSNLTKWYEDQSYNDAFTLSDAGVYADYKRYFRDLLGMTPNPDYFWTSPTGSRYKGIFYPRRQPTEWGTAVGGGDTIVNVLKDVECSYKDADGIGHQTDIRIVMNQWNKHRAWIAEQLRVLRNQNCWVDIVYSDGPDDTDKDVLAKLAPAPGTSQKPIQTTACRFTENGLSVVPHTKIMMIDGRYDDDIEPRVYTGSANFTAMSTADDSLVRIMGRTTHSAYLSWFYDLRSVCGQRT